jgi:hypothetical protein
MLTDQQLFENYAEWSWRQRSEGRPYLKYNDASAFAALKDGAVRYGASAHSAWTRAALEAAKSGAVKLLQDPKEIEIDDAFRLEVQKMPSSELLKRMQRDSDFRAKFDELSRQDSLPATPSTEVTSLSLVDYNSMPSEIIQRKYKIDPSFRAAVDKLFAGGEARQTNYVRA